MQSRALGRHRLMEIFGTKYLPFTPRKLTSICFSFIIFHFKCLSSLKQDGFQMAARLGNIPKMWHLDLSNFNDNRYTYVAVYLLFQISGDQFIIHSHVSFHTCACYQHFDNHELLCVLLVRYKGGVKLPICAIFGTWINFQQYLIVIFCNFNIANTLYIALL